MDEDVLFLLEDSLIQESPEGEILNPSIPQLNRIARKVSPDEATQEYFLQKARDEIDYSQQEQITLYK